MVPEPGIYLEKAHRNSDPTMPPNFPGFSIGSLCEIELILHGHFSINWPITRGPCKSSKGKELVSSLCPLLYL